MLEAEASQRQKQEAEAKPTSTKAKAKGRGNRGRGKPSWPDGAYKNSFPIHRHTHPNMCVNTRVCVDTQ